MSKGNRPAIKLSVKLKDGGERHYPGAAWPSKFDGGGLNMSLDPGWKLVGPDGTEYTTGREGNCYLDIFDNREDSGPPQRKAKPAADFDDDFDDAGDVPF